MWRPSKLIFNVSVLFTLFFISCKKDSPGSKNEHTFNFTSDTEGWNAFFSDYPVGKEPIYELSFRYSHLPIPLNTAEPALELHGNNHSDDLLSMVYRKFEGLEPNHEYQVSFRVSLASNIPSGSVGIGGSPDLSLGAGGLPFAPQNVLETADIEHFNRPNFQSALQSHESNENFKVIGRIGVSDTTTTFTLIERENLQDPIPLTTNDKGELWLMIGTDSGFEGPLTLYFKEIEIRIK
jgi:hypothetical protein